jgi:hypothetical protein
MNNFSSVYILDSLGSGWIIEKLMRDISDNLRGRNVTVNFGDGSDYSGEDIIFHSRYLYIKSFKASKINSVFVTHVDDVFKIQEISHDFNKVDSFVCMSSEDADKLKSIGCPPKKVVGIDLPHRGGFIKRPKLALFSDRYSDGRKNELWIIEYLNTKTIEERDSFIFCFLGHNWELFGKQLSKLKVSYEIYSYTRSMPGEYDMLKNILSSMNSLFYIGQDGGAMSAYDGFFQGIPMTLSNDGYHKGIPGDINFINCKEDFFNYLDKILQEIKSKETFLTQRSVDVYVDKLINHWNNLIFRSDIPSKEAVNFERRDFILQKPTIRRFVGSIYRISIKFIARKINFLTKDKSTL